jgi:hypothetical protein
LEARKKLYVALEAWFAAFIGEFRRLYDALPEDSKKRLSYLSDFRAPSQIVAFWAVEFEYQYILVIKEPEIQVDSVRVCVLSPPESMIPQAEAALKDDWFSSVPEPARTALDAKYKAIIQDHLLGVLHNLPQMRLRFPPREPGKTPILLKGPDSQEYFEWTIFGNLFASNPVELAARELSQAVSPGGVGQPPDSNKANTSPPKIEPIPPTRSGFVSAFSPGIWLGPPHTFTFREKLDGYFIPVSTKKVRLVYKGRELTVMLNGLLTMIEPDKKVCSGLLSEIMCVALLLGVPSTAVRDEDLSKARFYDNGDWAQYTMEISPRRSAILAKELQPIREAEYEAYKLLSEDQLRDIIIEAEKHTSDGNQSSFAQWYIDAYTSFEDPDYERCVIKSWLIIERHVNTMWEDHIRKTEGVSRKAGTSKEKILKDLLKWKVITPETHAKLDGLRERRNATFHIGSGAAREEVLEFLKTAEEITTAALGITG